MPSEHRPLNYKVKVDSIRTGIAAASLWYMRMMRKLIQWVKKLGLLCWGHFKSILLSVFDFDISVFHVGIMIFALVWVKLVWNVLVLIMQSYYWLLGLLVLGPGAGITAQVLISDPPSPSQASARHRSWLRLQLIQLTLCDVGLFVKPAFLLG
ncbi:hypothetical protein FB446DRAFT_705367 [Lentinula raphanica]|nr:hypothetical protein FB446DRAFT_705367 [Lentinula raphanica]